jgi:hypothetical protein
VTLAGTAGLLGLTPRQIVAEAPPETRTLRIAQSPAICFAPQYVAADQLFQAEGFVDVQYVKRSPLALETLVSGEADLASADVGSIEFIPLSFWYDTPLISQDSDRRHDPWLVYGLPSCSPARWSSWISRV